MADFDFGSILSGAGTGFVSGGPVGAAIGAGVGLLSNLFGGSDKQQTPQYQDLRDPQTSAMVQSLMNSKLGQQQAQRSSALIGNQTRTAQQQFGENANFQGNAAVTAAYNNKIARTGEEFIAGANIQGAQVDQDAMAKAAQLQHANNQFSLQRNQMANSNYQADYSENQKPNYLQNLMGNALTASVGTLLGKAGAKNPTLKIPSSE